MTRTIETISRRDFFEACPVELQDEMRDELLQWDGGDSCRWVEFSADRLGNIDSLSSPRPGTEPEAE